MIKIICDKCGDECDHNAFEAFVNFLRDYTPTHCKETDETPKVEKALDKARADTKTDIAKEYKYILAYGMGKN